MEMFKNPASVLGNVNVNDSGKSRKLVSEVIVRMFGIGHVLRQQSRGVLEMLTIVTNPTQHTV